MDLQNIAEQRVINQQLFGTKFKSPVKLLRWFGAMQAQEYGPTKWSFGLRIAGLKDEDVENDFTSGKILRTHVLRPTWHVVAAEDIRWMLALTKDRVHALNAYMYKQTELDRKTFSKCTKIIIDSLQGGKHETRESINEDFKKNKIKAEGHRLSYIMMHAELEGIICSGARKGNQFTYALMEDRVPASKSKTREEALASLTECYFLSRGLATVHDFATWSGLTVADCKQGIEILGKPFQELVVENISYQSLTRSKTKSSSIIHLLPIYDEYIMGYKNRDAILQSYHSIIPKPAYGYDNTIVFNGQVIGTWKRTIKPKTVEIEYHPFQPFNRLQHNEFDKAISRYEKFIGLKVILKSQR